MSIQGRSHVSRGIPCQDSSYSSELTEKYGLAVIADGVGSCKYSDEASKIAVSTIVKNLEEQRNNLNDDNILSLIEESYSKAKKEIEQLAIDAKQPINEYDTTLTVALYDGDKVYYGHSGDGGIIGLSDDGLYVKITQPQKGPDGISVVPLRFSDSWEFGSVNNISSLLLATDGVYDTFLPYLLKGASNEIYVPLISYYIDNNQISINKDNQSEIGQEIRDFLTSDSCNSITDDMTVAALFNPLKKASIRDPTYYEEPDWEKLQKKWNKAAYSDMRTQVESEITQPVMTKIVASNNKIKLPGYRPRKKSKKRR